MYASVSKVHMEGMNSSDRQQIHFEAGPMGVTQTFKGHAKNEINDKNLNHLPNIKLEKYSVRDNQFLKAADDPRSGRFLSYDQFPPNSTKSNIKGKHMLSDFRSSEQCKSIGFTPKYNCHHYMHEVNLESVRSKNDILVPFGLSANFATSQNFATTRNASQMYHSSPRQEVANKANDVVFADFSDTVMPKQAKHEERYRPSFKKNYNQQVKLVKQQKMSLKM